MTEETLRLVKEAGGQWVVHEVDVRNTPSVDAFAERAVRSMAAWTTRWPTPEPCATHPWRR